MAASANLLSNSLPLQPSLWHQLFGWSFSGTAHSYKIPAPTLAIQDQGRWGYSISKRLVKMTRFQCFPLQLPGYQDIPVIIFVASSTLIHVVWVLIRACRISWKLHLTGKTQFLKYWLTVNSIKINKFAASQTRPIGLFQKKNKQGGLKTYFFEKTLEFFIFLFYLWKFQTKQSFTPGIPQTF